MFGSEWSILTILLNFEKVFIVCKKKCWPVPQGVS